MVEHAACGLAWLLRLTLLLKPPTVLCFLAWSSFPREIFAYGCSNVLLLVYLGAARRVLCGRRVECRSWTRYIAAGGERHGAWSRSRFRVCAFVGEQ